MRTFLALVLSLWSTTLAALCTGDSFMDRITNAERAQIDAAVMATPYPSGLHWTATRGDKTLHVIGTMHIWDPRLDAVFERTVLSVIASDLLLVEATPEDEARLQSFMANNPEFIFLTEGPTLPERIEPALWENIVDAVRARMVPPFLASKMRPWYLSLTLAIPPCIVSELASGAQGLDHMLMDAAQAADVPLQAVENPLDLFETMNSGSFEEQIETLKLSLLAPDLQSEMFVAMLDAYFAGDIAEIWEASRISANYVAELEIEQSDQLFAEFEDALLIQRNLNWMPVIKEAANSNDVITLAVGAAHLPGTRGVLNLLAQDGWSITRNTP